MPDQFRRAMHRLRVATVTEQMRAIQAQEQPTNPAAAADLDAARAAREAAQEEALRVYRGERSFAEAA